MMMTVLLSSVFGALIASMFACLPGLHVYNLLGPLLICVHGLSLPSDMLVPFIVGMIVGYSMLSTVPSVLLAAPDESAVFTVLPGQKYLMSGRGLEGTVITAAGGLGGLLFLVLVVGPIAPRTLPVIHAVIREHAHWMLWCVICFMLMSEWPRGRQLAEPGWKALLASWRSTGAGLLTFVLSGLLGFILFYRSPVSVEASFQNLMPAFVGLFTIPWLVLNCLSGAQIPAQRSSCSSDLTSAPFLKGTLAGGLGGSFAAFVPVVTGGVGGFLAGHATALRDDRAFLVSQGASRLVYYVGGILLLFVPGLHITRGTGARTVQSVYAASSWSDYYMVLGAIAVSGAISFLLVVPLSRSTIRLIERRGYRQISTLAMAVVLLIVLGTTGFMGLLVMTVSAGIGLLPILFGSRRMNCLGIILLPAACNMSGVGAHVAAWLGLF